MAITAAEIETLVDAANTAAAGDDFATAVNKLRQAKALLAVLPDSIKDGNELSFDRAALDSLITSYQQLANASTANSSSSTTAVAGMQRTKLRYVRADDESQ